MKRIKFFYSVTAFAANGKTCVVHDITRERFKKLLKKVDYVKKSWRSLHPQKTFVLSIYSVKEIPYHVYQGNHPIEITVGVEW